ncbi:MAG: hypothetical protein GY805_11610 [Chloroflexi bacterium]|nr:hypothetical protein [Chloroflexota bacterium]
MTFLHTADLEKTAVSPPPQNANLQAERPFPHHSTRTYMQNLTNITRGWARSGGFQLIT